jgi:hypothetical protein
MSTTYQLNEALIKTCLHEYKAQKRENLHPNIKKITSDAGRVPPSTLQDQIKKGTSKSNRPKINQCFNQVQYNTLIVYINQLDKASMSIVTAWSVSSV